MAGTAVQRERDAAYQRPNLVAQPASQASLLDKFRSYEAVLAPYRHKHFIGAPSRHARRDVSNYGGGFPDRLFRTGWHHRGDHNDAKRKSTHESILEQPLNVRKWA